MYLDRFHFSGEEGGDSRERPYRQKALSLDDPHGFRRKPSSKPEETATAAFSGHPVVVPEG
jgi:hypothetical protein